MPKAEFKIINDYFRHFAYRRPDTLMAIGDDCALIVSPENRQIAIRLTQWFEPGDFNLLDEGNVTANNLLQAAVKNFHSTDLQPKWMTLSMTLPEIDEAWLKSFSQALQETAQAQEIQLIGGDTSSGPACLRLHLMA